MNSFIKNIYKNSTALVLLVVFVLVIMFSFFTSAQTAQAFPWGGQFQELHRCLNDNAIWVKVGPPRGGKYVWKPGTTKTYDYGPPRRVGQWGLGLASPPYVCLISTAPLINFTGIIMTMLGTSQ